MLAVAESKNGACTELKICERCRVHIESAAKFCHLCGFPTNKALLAKMQEINKSTMELIDKNMLSEMIKKIVLEEIRNRK